MSFIETVDLKCYMVTQPSHPSTLANHPKMRARVQICFEFFKDACWSLENKAETCREQKFPRLLFFFQWRMFFFVCLTFFTHMVQNSFLAVFTHSAKVNVKFRKTQILTAPSCFKWLLQAVSSWIPQCWDSQFGVMSRRLWGVCPKNSGRMGSWKLVQTIWNDSAT